MLEELHGTICKENFASVATIYPSKLIAVTMPGKMGDAIYALPAIRWLCDKHKTQAVFWTSQYCSPLKRLFEYQSCIASMEVNNEYTISHMGMGVQPWLLPVPNEDQYEQVYHLGYKTVPKIYLPNFISQSVGGPVGLPIFYEYPKVQTPDEDYIVVAPRGEQKWRHTIDTLSNKFTVVQVGGSGDKVSSAGIDKTGLDFLETVAWMANTKLFMGCKSSQLVLAEGFKMHRSLVPLKESVVAHILNESS